MLSTDLEVGYIDKIPIRNLWLLMLYASQLFRQVQTRHENKSIEENPDDIPDLVAEILIESVNRRLRRNLTLGYKNKGAVLGRVRGRINHLQTERQQLLSRGKIFCSFEELTINTPRNQFVKAALLELSKVTKPECGHKCRALAITLGRMGVSDDATAFTKFATERVSRHDANDHQMLAAAKLAYDLALPTEFSGQDHPFLPERESSWVRNLYEKGIAGFYDAVLPRSEWQVYAGERFDWQTINESNGLKTILPTMKTDIIINNLRLKHRIIIDTKFTTILSDGYYRQETLRSGYIYQIYAYLRSQEGKDELASNSSGILLHPTVDKEVDEFAEIQGHRIHFATVNLAASAREIRNRLLEIVGAGDTD